MKQLRSLFSVALILAIFISFESFAQDLPQPSPGAMFKQTVGLTDITITYSRPGVKDRKIWGELVPYDKMWRTGANKATKVEFSDDVTISGTKVPKGAYSLFVIPGEMEWEVVLNKNTELWGTGDYKKEEDLLRVKAKPMATDAFQERMNISVENLMDNSAEVVLHWEKLQVSLFKVEVDVASKAMANIEKAISEAKPEDWRVYTRAADYCANSNTNIDKGLQWVDKALTIEDYWWSRWVKAELLSMKNDYKGAIENAQKAIELGEAKAVKDNTDFGYKKQLEEDIAGWKLKM